MAKLLGGDDEDKQKMAGIMQFAGDPRGLAAAGQDSLLDRSVNLFKRVSDAYQHKNRSGGI